METTSDHPRRLPGILVGAHVALVAFMSAWRAIETTPGLASVAGGDFAGSTIGRAFAFASVLGGVCALVLILVLTLKNRSDWRALLLCVSLGAALAARESVDVFDLVYVALVAIVAMLALVRGRDRTRSLA